MQGRPEIAVAVPIILSNKCNMENTRKPSGDLHPNILFVFLPEKNINHTYFRCKLDFLLERKVIGFETYLSPLRLIRVDQAEETLFKG